MFVIRLILGIVGMAALVPSFLLFPALIITAIIGASNKDYTYLKKYLKIWGYSLLALIGVLILYAVAGFVSATMSR